MSVTNFLRLSQNQYIFCFGGCHREVNGNQRNTSGAPSRCLAHSLGGKLEAAAGWGRTQAVGAVKRPRVGKRSWPCGDEPLISSCCLRSAFVKTPKNYGFGHRGSATQVRHSQRGNAKHEFGNRSPFLPCQTSSKWEHVTPLQNRRDSLKHPTRSHPCI